MSTFIKHEKEYSTGETAEKAERSASNERMFCEIISKKDEGIQKAVL